jgi:outer membrane protein assembly factor BamB
MRGQMRNSVVLLVVVASMLLVGRAFAAPTIALSKRIGPPTSKILVSGSGFEPNVGVDIYFDTKDEALVVTNNEGEFHHAAIHAPREAKPGKHWVTALERNHDTGDQEPFVVYTNWSQFLFDDGHSGLNPYENVLDPKTVGALTLLFSGLPDGEVGYGSPTLADGIIYVACRAGFCAANAETGAILWEHAIYGIWPTPAVLNDVVYVGSDDNNLYALNANTGILLWRYTTGGLVRSAPAVVDGLVYVGSGDSNVYALDAKTGIRQWNYTTGNSVESSPAVVNGVVYVGSYDNNLYALNAKTGALLWKYATGGSIASSPAVGNGIVYFASYDSDLYAVTAQNGSFLWKVPTGELTYSSPVLAGGIVYYNAWTRPLLALNAQTGSLLWSIPENGGSGSPAVANGVLYAELNGNISAFNAQTGARLWTGSGQETPIVANGMVYVYSLNGVYAYGLRATDATDASSSCRPEFSKLHPDLKK